MSSCKKKSVYSSACFYIFWKHIWFGLHVSICFKNVGIFSFSIVCELMDFIACLILECKPGAYPFTSTFLYAYCHRNINVKNVSHDSCTEVFCEWAGICFSYDYGLVLCFSFLLTSLHPDIPTIRKQTSLCLDMQSYECLRPAQFSSAVRKVNSTFCDTVSPLRVRSVSTGHSGSIEVKPEICVDLPIYNQVAYE